jgi:hypothetical protein
MTTETISKESQELENYPVHITDADPQLVGELVEQCIAELGIEETDYVYVRTVKNHVEVGRLIYSCME